MVTLREAGSGEGPAELAVIDVSDPVRQEKRRAERRRLMVSQREADEQAGAGIGAA